MSIRSTHLHLHSALANLHFQLGADFSPAALSAVRAQLFLARDRSPFSEARGCRGVVVDTTGIPEAPKLLWISLPFSVMGHMHHSIQSRAQLFSAWAVGIHILSWCTLCSGRCFSFRLQTWDLSMLSLLTLWSCGSLHVDQTPPYNSEKP